MGKTGIPMPILKALTIRATAFMRHELNELSWKYGNGELLISYGRYAKLRIGIMNNYSIKRIQMIAAVIEKEVKSGNTTWEEQFEKFGADGKAKSRSTN